MAKRRLNLSMVSSAILLSVFGLSRTPALANDVIAASLRNAKEAEAAGRYTAAIGQYISLAQGYGSAPVPIELARLAQRRALALQIVEVRKGNSNVSTDSIYTSYLAMKKLEPDNPTWPYLQALFKLQVQERYFDVFPLFHQAINCRGGEQSVRQKASADLEKYRPIINARVDEQNEITKKKDWDWDHGGRAAYESGLNAMIHAHHAPSVSPTSSGSSGNGDWSASQNAQKAGDWGAASRLSNGSSTWSDRDSYSH
ncbi:MAG: hypothetical protein K2X81_11235 [Candidatus Obscuribacterales bacterium]|nr:hypothetical protein [Candidatus Obscuribacterales bacterium]